MKHTPGNHEDDARLSEQQLEVITSFVRDRLAEPIRVADLARRVEMSASCFARRFRSTTGRTPHSFIVGQRVARAAELIERGSNGAALRGAMPLARIAILCGFADQAHLTRCFRRTLGTTPAEYCRQAAPDRQ